MDKIAVSYAQKILAELKVIATNIVQLVHAKPDEHSTPNQNSSDSNSSETQAKSMRKPIAAKAEPPPRDNTHTDDDDRKPHHWLRKHKPVINFIGLLALVVYTGLTGCLTLLTSKSLTALKKANEQSASFFNIQNRPWAGLDGKFTGSRLVAYSDNVSTPTYLLRVDYKLKNFGTAPALTAAARFKGITGPPSNPEETSRRIDDLCGEIEKNEIAQNLGNAILPNGTYESRYQHGVLTDDWKTIVMVIGCLAYLDPNTTKVHHTKMCFTVDLRKGDTDNSPLSCGLQSAD